MMYQGMWQAGDEEHQRRKYGNRTAQRQYPELCEFFQPASGRGTCLPIDRPIGYIPEGRSISYSPLGKSERRRVP